MRTCQAHKVCGLQTQSIRVFGVHIHKGFGQMRRQSRAKSCPRHRVPLIAQTPRVQPERALLIRHRRRIARRQRQHLGLAIRVVETTVSKEPATLLCRALGPAEWRQRVIVGVGNVLEIRDIKVAAERSGDARQRRIFAENLGRAGPVETVKAHAFCNLGQNPPIRLGNPRCGQNRALPRYGTIRVCDRAGFFGPCRRRQQHIRATRGVGAFGDIADHDKIAAFNTTAHAVGIRQGHGRVRMDHPQRLDPAFAQGAEHIDRFQTGLIGHSRRRPEPLHGLAVVGVFQIKVTGQHIGQTTHFAPAHRIGLSRYRKRPHAKPTDAASGKMAVQDRIDLICAGRRLVHALTENGHDLFRPDPEIEECLQIAIGQACDRRIAGLGSRNRVIRATDISVDIGAVQKPAPVNFRQQGIEQRHVAARPQSKVQIRAIAACRATGINDHQFGATGFPRGQNALVQNRMTPSEVRTGQNNQIGVFKVLIGAGHRVGAKGAFVPCHGRRHTQTRIGIDIGRADETLHQLVGDVIVFAQHLARYIERHRIRPVFRDRFRERLCHMIQRAVPIGVGPVNARGHQPVRQTHRFGQSRSFGTQTPEVRRMVRIPFDGQATLPVRR